VNDCLRARRCRTIKELLIPPRRRIAALRGIRYSYIMYFRLDYYASRRALSNFQMSHAPSPESVSGKLIREPHRERALARRVVAVMAWARVAA